MDTLTIPADLAELSGVGAFVRGIAEAAGLERRAAYRLRLAVDEIVTNIITHGYGANPGEVTLEAATDERGLTLTIVDAAVPFDPLAHGPVTQIDAPLEERELGGLGVHLAVAGVDEFRYEYRDRHNRNILLMHTEPG